MHWLTSCGGLLTIAFALTSATAVPDAAVSAHLALQDASHLQRRSPRRVLRDSDPARETKVLPSKVPAGVAKIVSGGRSRRPKPDMSTFWGVQERWLWPTMNTAYNEWRRSMYAKSQGNIFRHGAAALRARTTLPARYDVLSLARQFVHSMIQQRTTGGNLELDRAKMRDYAKQLSHCTGDTLPPQFLRVIAATSVAVSVGRRWERGQHPVMTDKPDGMAESSWQESGSSKSDLPESASSLQRRGFSFFRQPAKRLSSDQFSKYSSDSASSSCSLSAIMKIYYHH